MMGHNESTTDLRNVRIAVRCHVTNTGYIVVFMLGSAFGMFTTMPYHVGSGIAALVMVVLAFAAVKTHKREIRDSLSVTASDRENG